MTDIDVMAFARYLSFLEPMPPITKTLDQWGSSYPSQKIHVCDWLSHQSMEGGKGAYSRAKANCSAKAMYNRFLNPGGLLWIAEALGEGERVLRAAVEAAIRAEAVDYRARCKAFRSVLPWGRIMELLADYEQWRYDAKIAPLLALDYKTGLPIIKDGCRAKYQKIIDREWTEK